MKLTDYKNEDALDLLADIMEPIAKIMADKDIAAAFKAKEQPVKIAKKLIKSHKTEIIEVLAIIEGVDVKDYKGTILTMTKTLLEILNDEELTSFFTSQG